MKKPEIKYVGWCHECKCLGSFILGRVYRAKRPRGVHRLDGSYVNDRQILYISPFGRKNFLTILKNKEIVRTMIKKERERQIKKAYIFYRRRVKTLLATGRYLLTIDYRKKDINNEK